MSTILQALKLRYPSESHALFPEVANGTGGNCTRRCDALAMSLWASRGLELIGFEFKTSRKDLINELKNPSKADAIQRYCHRWYLVLGDIELIREGELPPMWGLMYMTGGHLRVKKEAPELQPIPIDYKFLAGILRSAQDYRPSNETHQLELAKAREEGVLAGQAGTEWETKRLQDKVKQLEESIQNFEDSSGVNIRNRWTIGNIGAAVKVLTDGNTTREEAVMRVTKFEQDCRRTADLLAKALNDIKGAN